MRKSITGLLCLTLGLVGWSSALAQEEEPAPDAEYSAPESEYGKAYREIITFDVLPSEASGFEASVEKLVLGANEASLSADYGWYFFRDGSTFYLIYPVADMAYFDDPEQWMRQFPGTPGEATVMEAFGDFAQLTYTSRSSVAKIMPEWSYKPATATETGMNYVHVYQDWVRTGSQEPHAENTKALLAILEEVGYPYEVIGMEIVIGDGGLRTFVVPYDNTADFYGKNSINVLLAQHEKGEAWAALLEERMGMLNAMDDYDVTYVPGMSYFGPVATETAQASSDSE